MAYRVGESHPHAVLTDELDRARARRLDGATPRLP